MFRKFAWFVKKHINVFDKTEMTNVFSLILLIGFVVDDEK